MDCLHGRHFSQVDISDVSADDIMACDSLIVGAPTWHTGADSERSGTVPRGLGVTCGSLAFLFSLGSNSVADGAEKSGRSWSGKALEVSASRYRSHSEFPSWSEEAAARMIRAAFRSRSKAAD